MSDIPLAPLIVLEGIDGSGKGTQSARLVDRLIRHGLRAALLSFPRYQATFFGARIGEFLDGQFGPLEQLDPFLISLLYAGDRFESRQTLLDARSRSDIVVLDRYVPSNIAHQSAKREGPQRDQLRSWIEQLEYEIFELPRPNLVVLLDIPVEASQQLIRKKSRRTYTDQATDLQEADTKYLQRVREVYLTLAANASGWAVVPVTSDESIRPVEDVEEEVWRVVQPVAKIC